MKTLRTYVAVVMVALAVACGSPRSLDQTGPYGRIDAMRPPVTEGLTLGQQLVLVDQNIVGAKSLIDSFLLWEHNNRTFIASGSIKAFAARLEREAPRALQSATRVRDAYATDPSSGNRSNLEAALQVLDALVLELALYRPATATPVN